MAKKIRIKSVPQMQYGGNMPVTPQEREAWNKAMGQMRQQPGTYARNWDHNQDFQREFMQNQGFDPNRVQAIQNDMLQRNQSMQGSVSYGPQGMSPADNWLGSKTQDQRYVRYSYEHLDKNGTRYPGAAGFTDRGTEPMSSPEMANWAQGPGMPNQWRANNMGVGTDAPQQDIDKLYQAQGAPAIPTREDAISKWKARGKKSVGQEDGPEMDYSIDSVREGQAKFGGPIKRKIRITGSPDHTPMAQYGGQQAGNGYALDRTWGTTAGYPGIEGQPQPFGKVGRTLPEAENGGDINAEKQEQILGDFDQDGNQELMNVNGPAHTEGGKDVNVPQNSFVFSDTRSLKIKDKDTLDMFGLKSKRGGYTPAEIAKKYDLNKYKAIIDNPDSDETSKRTAQLMTDNYLAKLSRLAQVQEGMKGMLAPKQQPGQDFSGLNPEMMQPGMQYGGGVSPQFASSDPIGYLGYSEGNKVIGIPEDEARKLLNGKDRVPYTPEIAARIGYNGEYGHNVKGLQQWEREQAPGYSVSNEDMHHGLPDGILGVRTLSPPIYSGYGNMFDNPHDTPGIPQMPSDLDDYTKLKPTAGSPAPSSNPVTEERKLAISAQKTTGKGKSRIPTFGPNFLGDVLNLSQMANVNRFQAFEPAPQAVIPDTVFLDPTREIAAQQETARNAMEIADRGANSRASRATALAIQGEAGKQASDTIGKYHNQNVVIANEANRQAAGITNDLMAKQATRLAELNKANFLSDRDYKREMGKLQSEFVGRLQQHHDQNVKTAWLNKTSPYFDIDPVTQMPVFKSGDAKARFEKEVYGQGAGDASKLDYQTLVKQYVNQNHLPQDEAEELAKETIAQALKVPRTKQTYSDPATGRKTITSSPYVQKFGGPYMEMGGIPQYAVGGDFLPMAGGPDPYAFMPPGPTSDNSQAPTDDFAMPPEVQQKRLSKKDIATATNNPGNIKYTPWMKNLGAVPSGIPGQDGGEFAAFPDLNAGFNAYKTQLFGDTDGVFKSNFYKANTSIDKALKTWSNNGYGAEIYPAVKGKTLGELTPEERDELVKRQIKRESASMYSLLHQRGVFEYGGSPLQKFIR